LIYAEEVLSVLILNNIEDRYTEKSNRSALGNARQKTGGHPAMLIIYTDLISY
jgi:hypothetical protein